MDEFITNQTMPNSLEAEQSVVGSIIKDKDALMTVSEILNADDFYNGQYKLIYSTLVEMHDAGKHIDALTVQEALREKGAPADVCEFGFLRSLAMSVPTTSAAYVREYATIVKDKSILRNIINTNASISKLCYDGIGDTEYILNETEKKIFELVKNKGAKDNKPVRDVVVEALQKISKAAMSKGSVTGVPTGFRDLDYYLSGLQPSDFILVAARPSMGKTAFVLNIAEHVALKEGITTAIFSLEMADVQLINRMLSLESGVDADKLRKGNLDSTDWDRLVEGADSITRANSHLIIDDTPGISISQLRSKCRKYKMENNLGLVIIDYLQLMSGNGKSGDNRQQEISEISRALKALARELDVPVVTLSQLSRAVESRPDHRPMLSDLRESGAIEQDADVVMFLYRDDYYNKDTELKGIAEIIVAKQRNGPVGTIKMAWIPNQTRFANLLQEKK